MTKSCTHKTKPKAKPAKKQQWANLQKTTKTSKKHARPQDSDNDNDNDASDPDDKESSDQELVAKKGRATMSGSTLFHLTFLTPLTSTPTLPSTLFPTSPCTADSLDNFFIIQL